MFEMDNQQLLMFKGWFIDSYPECKDYLDLTYFDVEKNTFLSKCSYNPDSGNAAKVLKIAFGSWQHQQAKVEEANAKAQMCRDEKNHAINRWSVVCKERDELQKRVDAIAHLIRGLRAEFDLWMDVECPQVERQIELLEQALKGEG